MPEILTVLGLKLYIFNNTSINSTEQSLDKPETYSTTHICDVVEVLLLQHRDNL